MEDELLMAISPEDLAVSIDGMEALAKNGLRYPIPHMAYRAMRGRPRRKLLDLLATYI